MKEIFAELKKNAEAINLVSEELHGQIERLEGSTRAQIERMEAIQVSNESQFSQLNSVMAQILQRLQSIPGSSHGSTNSYKEPPKNSFQR